MYQMLMRSMQKKNNKKGFTLVELMVVVIIIGILVAIAIPMYSSVTANANKKAIAANLRTIEGAIQAEQANASPAAPTSANLVTGGYLQSWPDGPTGSVYAVASFTPTGGVLTYYATVTTTNVNGVANATYTLNGLNASTALPD